MKVERTTFECEGTHQPCIIVSSDSGYAQVRISKYHHLIGKHTLLVRENLGGEYNNDEEFQGDFDSLTPAEAVDSM